MEISQEFKDKIQHVANLPTLPQIASRLIRIINDPMTSSNDVAFIIGQDLSLSAKVLRLANSAFYGVPKSITNINSAFSTGRETPGKIDYRIVIAGQQNFFQIL